MKKLAFFLENYFPSPIIIAIFLTLIAFLSAFFCANFSSSGFFNHLLETASFWEKGLWELLEFGMQMMLMLILGHIIALSKIADKFLDRSLNFVDSNRKAAILVLLVSLVSAFFNWGLSLILGAILAKKVKDFSASKGIPINFPLIGACAYSGLMVWHGGLSGSAPLKVAESGHFLEDKYGIIGVENTLFSTMNIVSWILILVLLVAFVFAISTKNSAIPKSEIELDVTDNQLNGKSFSEKLELSFVPIAIISLLFLLAFVSKIQSNSDSLLKLFTPNFINFVLFGFAILLHKNFRNFNKAASQAVEGGLGILIQFPLYAGIMGLVKYSGMVEMVSTFFVEHSTANTFPFITFCSAAIVNIFVPSGGGQWAIQGPIILESALQLNVDFGKTVMALAYGDQLTNMLQPFWALPLLGITKLKASQIFPYTLAFMFIGFIVFSLMLWVF